MMQGADLQNIFPYILFPSATLLISISLVFLIARSADVGKEFRLFAVSCIVLLFWSFAHVGSHVFSYTGIAARFSSLLPLPIFLLPLLIHLTHIILKIENRGFIVLAAYVAASLTTGISWMGWDDFPHMNSYISALIFIGAFYSLSCFIYSPDDGEKSITPLPRRCLASGIILILVLLGLNFMLGGAFAPLSLSFVSLVLISTGLVIHSGSKEREAYPTGTSLLYTFIISFVLLPVFSNLLFISCHSGSIYIGDITSWLFHRSIITIVSLIIASLCAYLSFRKIEKRVDALLYMVICILACILDLRDLITTGLPQYLSRQVVPINDIFLVNIIGICGHMMLVKIRKAKTWNILACYAVGLSLIPVMLYESYTGMSLFAYGPMAYKGLSHFLFIVVFMVMLAVYALILQKGRKTKSDTIGTNERTLILAGVMSAIAILAGSMITGIGLSSYPFYNLNSIPLVLIGLGIFYRDIQRINVYTRRQIISNSLRLILAVIYLLLLLGIVKILKNYTLSHVIDGLIPYGIPPLLSFVSAAFLALFILGLEKNRPESQLFSLISFCYSMLNLDICLLGIVQDPKLALFISRVDHFFLALLLMGVNLHITYLVIGKKDQWWVVYLSYVIGFIMAPLSQTEFYFNGVHDYFWGFFVRKSFLYDVMSTMWGVAIVYGIYLLAKASKRADIKNRKTVKHVLTAFVIIALLSLSNNPAIYGYEIYPLGTFIFVALFYLAYGLFKFNFKMALQYVRIISFWAGLIVITLLAGLAPGLFLMEEGVYYRVFFGVLLIAVLYHPIRKGWNAVLNLFIRKSSDVLKESYYRLTDGLSRIHHRDKIHQMLCSWFFDEMEGSCFTSLFALKDLSGQKIYYGWKTWNKQNETGLFGETAGHSRENSPLQIRKDHPLIELCKYEQTIYTQENLLRINPSIHAFNGNDGVFQDAEIVIPIISRGVLLAIFLLGRKADGSPYSRSEFDILHNLSLVLGPHIENAFFLEGLEDKVDKRTRELNHALKESVQKEKEIRENSEVITRQNQIFRTLLETSTKIHHMESLDDLFSFILSRLHTLFADFRGGIILENKRRNILEATSFIGISDIEQKAILAMRDKIMAPDFGNVLNEALAMEGIPASADNAWTVFPMEGRGNRIVGHMIFKGQIIDRQTKEIFTVFLGQLSAVTQNKLLMIQLERMASTDGLTGLYNRAFLNQELRKVVLHAKRFKNIFFSIMIIDLNGLKRLNDSYGHEKGDEAIIKVAHHLKSLCRTTDIVSRLGGDEFAILMPSTNYSQAEILFKRIVESSGTLSVVVSGHGEPMESIPVHVSVGLASSDDTQPDEVMKKADTLMYEAKEKYYAEREVIRG